jgi:acyl-CoA thioester hydrolase
VRTRAEGFALVASRYEIEYLKPALLGDELELVTWISEASERTLQRHFVVNHRPDESLAVFARASWLCTDAHSNQPIPFPDKYLADLSAHAVTDPDAPKRRNEPQRGNNHGR